MACSFIHDIHVWEIAFTAPRARLGKISGWRLDRPSAHFMQRLCRYQNINTLTCHLTCSVDAFGVAVRTAQRCLGHYRRFWAHQGWVWCEFVSKEKSQTHALLVTPSGGTGMRQPTLVLMRVRKNWYPLISVSHPFYDWLFNSNRITPNRPWEFQ